MKVRGGFPSLSTVEESGKRARADRWKNDGMDFARKVRRRVSCTVYRDDG